MHHLTTYEQFESLMQSGQNWILFKHSGRCSISGGACKEVELAIHKLELDAVYVLDVIATGDLKYQIADALKIKHESPQVIIIQDGRVKSHASHSSISQ